MQPSVSEQITRIIEDINVLPEQVQRACIFALNRTAEWMKSEVAMDEERSRKGNIISKTA